MLNLELLDKWVKYKVMILGSGDNSVRFRPHLNVEKKDISLAIEKIHMVAQSLLN